MSGSPVTMSADEARRVTLFAQGLLGPRLGGGPATTVRHLGGVQLDTISVLARSHELVAYARHGPIPRASIEAAYWGPESLHLRVLVPRSVRAPARGMAVLRVQASGLSGTRAPLAPPRRRGRQLRRRRGPPARRRTADRPRARGCQEGRHVVGLVGDQDRGRVVTRHGRARLPGAAWVSTGLRPDRTRHPCRRCRRWRGRTRNAPSGSSRRPGGRSAWPRWATWPSTRGYRRSWCSVSSSTPTSSPLLVQGWDRPAFVAPGATDVLARRLKTRNVLLSPFDSLTWDRARTERVFGFHHRLEAYVPRQKRQYGYFAMPVLGGNKLVGLVDPGRRGQTLVAEADHAAPPGVRHAVWRRHSSTPRRGSIVTTSTSSVLIRSSGRPR